MSDGITIITKPEVYVLGKQVVQSTELDRFLRDHGIEWSSDSHEPAEVLTETAGRICYMSFARPRPGGNSAYLNHIKEVGHGSVLEHGVWNLLLTGVSRSLTHELVRHRAGWAYSQLSQRYVDESVAEYVEPDIIASEPDLHAIWLESVRQSHEAYVKLAEKIDAKLREQVKRGKQADHPWLCSACFGTGTAVKFGKPDNEGVTPLIPVGGGCPTCNGSGWKKEAKTEMRKAARQASRSVLPNATETKIFVTANARALRHFLEQRGSQHAEPEIRKLANAMLEVLAKDSPNLFGDYERHPLPDGTFELRTKYPKV